jgi:Protein kinase domain
MRSEHYGSASLDNDLVMLRQSDSGVGTLGHTAEQQRLVAELDMMQERGDLFIGRYALLGFLERRSGGHGIIQASTVRDPNLAAVTWQRLQCATVAWRMPRDKQFSRRERCACRYVPWLAAAAFVLLHCLDSVPASCGGLPSATQCAVDWWLSVPVQFATRVADKAPYAIKFFLRHEAFDTELALYQRKDLRDMLPVLASAERNDGPVPHSSGGVVFPPFLIMERGESLNQWSLRVAPDPPIAMCVLCHVAARLTRLHEAGLCHCDLKPANILWQPQANAWTLIDFGCSAAIGALMRWKAEAAPAVRCVL